MNFKDFAAADVGTTFLNPNEFATLHNIDGIDMLVVVDEDVSNARTLNMGLERALAYGEGLSVSTIKVYIDPLVYAERPVQGQMMTFDGMQRQVLKVSDQDGLYAVTLEAHIP